MQKGVLLKTNRFTLPRLRISLRLLLLITAAVAIALVVWKPLLIRYHNWGMDYASSQVLASSGQERTDYCAVYDAHLAALVRLEYYETRRFTLAHIKAGSPESRELLSSLKQFSQGLPRPEGATYQMDGYRAPFTCTVQVWAKSKHMGELAAIIESHDSASKTPENAQQ